MNVDRLIRKIHCMVDENWKISYKNEDDLDHGREDGEACHTHD